MPVPANGSGSTSATISSTSSSIFSSSISSSFSIIFSSFIISLISSGNCSGLKVSTICPLSLNVTAPLLLCIGACLLPALIFNLTFVSLPVFEPCKVTYTSLSTKEFLSVGTFGLRNIPIFLPCFTANDILLLSS